MPRLVLTALLQLYLLAVVPIRFAFNWMRPVHVIVIEALACDLPLLLNNFVLAVLVAPVPDRSGLDRFPAVWPTRIVSLFLKRPAAWLALLGSLPLEIAGAAVASYGEDVVEQSYFGGLYENVNSVESPVWHTNRIFHGILFISTFVTISDLVLFRLGWNPEITRLISSFGQLLLVSHLLACVGIKWRSTEPRWLIRAFNTTSLTFSSSSTVAGNATTSSASSFSQVDAFRIYITKHDWMLKQMAGFDAGPVTFPDLFRFLLSVGIVLVGTVLSSLIIAVISAFVERETDHTALGRAIDAVMDASDHMKLPASLVAQIIDDVAHRATATTHMLQPLHVFSQVPPSVLRRILEFQGAQVVSHVPLFQPCLAAPELLVEIAKSLQPIVLPPLQILFRKGDPGVFLYFVVDGWLAVLKDAEEEEHYTANNLHNNNNNNNTVKSEASVKFALDMTTAAASDEGRDDMQNDEAEQQEDDDATGWKSSSKSQQGNDDDVGGVGCGCCCRGGRTRSKETRWETTERLRKQLIAADEAREQYRLGPGHVIGEISVIAHSPRTATVRARRQQFVHLLSLSRETLDTQQTRFPQIFALIRYAAKVRYLDMVAKQQQQQQQEQQPQHQQHYHSPRKVTKVEYVRAGPRRNE